MPFLITAFLLSDTANAQSITTIAGQQKSACSVEPCGDGGLAKDAKLYSPSGMAVDADGNIYIAEFSRHAIRKINVQTGIITSIAGLPRSSCTTAPCGDGGLATAAQLNGPRGVAFDADGNMYIADFSNHAIRKIDKNTGVITTVAGTIRSSCSAAPCGDGGLAKDAKLNSPTRIAFDAQGNLFIADYGNQVIRKVDKNTGIISTYAGTMKVSCAVAPCSDGSLATSATFNGPSGVAIDANDNVFVTEYGNHTVRRIDKNTGIITTFAGTSRASCSVFPCGDGGLATSTDARLTSPFSLRVGPDNNIYIADASNAAIRKVDQTTNIITTVAGTVKSSCGAAPCGDGSAATAAQLSNPFDVDFSPDGTTMYILEYSNQDVRQVANMIALPVRMTEVSAVRQGLVVDLSWISHQEENVNRYEVERSSDGIAFIRIGMVAVPGSGQSRLNYQWQDAQPLSGFNYYRIKSVDNDGASRYSGVVVAGPAKKTMQKLSVSPNPVSGQSVQVQFTSSLSSQVEVVLFNNAGQKLLSKMFIGTGVLQKESFALPAGLPRGIYTLYVGNSKEEIGREGLVIQ